MHMNPSGFVSFKYTPDQASKIRENLVLAGFARKAEWPALLKTITAIAGNAKAIQLRDTLAPTLYAGVVAKQRDQIIDSLCKALKGYAALPPEMQFRLLPNDADVECIAPLLIRSLRESERPALKKLLTPTRFRLLLGAIIQHTTAPRLLHDVPKTGAPKDRAVRYAVRELWYVFEQATGKEPTAYPSSYGKNGAGFAGAFYDFVTTTLGPTKIASPKTLGSKINAAYAEWRKSVRPNPRADII